MKKILVPTDFSDQSKYALDLALEIAQKAGAEVTVMHVIEYAKKQTTFLGSSGISTMASLSTGVDIDDVYFVQLFRKRKEQMIELLSDLKTEGVKITDKIMLGTPYHAIAEEITESENDFIVMGTTGVSDWEESLIGSTAEKVVRHSGCPVITLRNPARLDQIKNIAFASNFKDIHADYIRIVKKLQKFFNAIIHFVYINNPNHFKNQREMLKIMGDFTEEYQFNNFAHHIYCHQNEEEGIIGFTEDNKMDMIMMITHGRSGISRLFDHSIAEDVVNFSKKPVLTFNLQHLK